MIGRNGNGNGAAQIGRNGHANEATRLAAEKGVLVVDDEPQMLVAIEDELSDKFRVVVETSARAAIKRLEPEKDLSVIISDQRMPGMSGYEFLSRAQEISNATRILITGYSDIEAVIAAVNRGRIFGYISKPWDPEQLKLIVMKANEHFGLLKELSDEKNLLHNLMDNIPDGIVFKDRGHRYLRVNKVAADRLGIAYPHDAVGRKVGEFLPPELAREIEEEERKIFAAGTPITDKIVRVKSERGKVRWFSVTQAPVRGEKEQISSIVAIQRDITKRMIAEQALHEAQERARLIVEGALDACVAVSAEGAVIEWNKQAELTFGWSREEALGRNMVETIIPTRYRDAHRRGLARLLGKGKGRILNERLELFALHKDKREFPVEITVSPIKMGGGHIFNAFIRDISERKAHEEGIARLTRLYAVLSGINVLIVRVRDRQQLFEEACRIAVRDGRLGMAWVGLYDREATTIAPVASHGEGMELVASRPFDISETRPEGQGTVGQAIRSKKLAVCNDIAAAPDLGTARRKAIGIGYGSIVSLPLVVNNEVFGVFALYAHKANFFDETETRLLEEMAGDISFALENIGKEEKLSYLALYDALTGLPNRTLFSDHLAQHVEAARRTESSVALLLVDVERFRHFNEALGRHAGDALLKGIAGRLMQAAVVKDGVSRISSDCFALVLPGVRGVAEVAHFVNETLLPPLHQAFEMRDEEIRIATKVGIALFPDDAGSADALFANAESALEKAKSSGDRYVFYAAEMNAKVADTLRLETKLRKALEAEQFILYYQPKVDLKTNKIMGLEALIRWNDPETGLVRPDMFIPILEETGLIVEAGGWALKKVLLDYGVWVERGLLPPRISVNASSIQLRRDDFVDTVANALEGNRDAAQLIDLEITESAIMEDVESHIPKLRALKDMGIRIAIDDFGTGYSSLAYIAKLPVHELKIDRTFIVNMTSNPDDMSIVSTVISLAHALELTVIAEGVETEEQAKLLRLLKCDQMQGFLFCKPRPPEEIQMMLAKRPA